MPRIILRIISGANIWEGFRRNFCGNRLKNNRKKTKILEELSRGMNVGISKVVLGENFEGISGTQKLLAESFKCKIWQGIGF